MFFNFGMVAFTMMLPLLMLLEAVTSRCLLSYRVAIMGFFMVAGPMVSAGDGKPLRNTDLPILESNNYKIWAMSFMVMIAAGDKAVHALLKLYEDNGNALPDKLHVFSVMPGECGRASRACGTAATCCCVRPHSCCVTRPCTL